MPNIDFKNTLVEADLGASAYCALGECGRFGIVSGCAPECPVFERGECELQKENEEQFVREGLL